jgi:hypothetical protein
MSNARLKYILLAGMIMAITVTSASLATYLAFVTGSKELFISNGIYELTYQFFLIVVIGGVVGGFLSLAFRAYEEKQKSIAETEAINRARRDAKKTLLGNLYSDLIVLYNDAKKVRRILKAKSKLIDRARVINFTEYEKNLIVLEDVQLKLEQHIKEVEASGDILDGKTTVFKKNLIRMEKYLRLITERYEERKWAIVSDDHPDLIVLDKVTQAFISSKEVQPDHFSKNDLADLSSIKDSTQQYDIQELTVHKEFFDVADDVRKDIIETITNLSGFGKNYPSKVT